MAAYDFVAVGDITTDAFIKLKEASVHCDVNRGTCQICMDFAAKVPYESVTVVPAVGNSPNAAVAAARLGLKSALVTNLGDDYHGEEARTALNHHQVSLDFVISHPGQKTNYHYVLWYEDDRTILVKHEEYPYALPDELTKHEPSWIYLSSMGPSSLPFHDTIADYLEAHPDVRLAFQPGTFQINAGAERLARLYERTDVFFCNVEEATRILQTETNDTNKKTEKIEKIKDLLTGIEKLGPKIVVITDGPEGAYAYDTTATWFIPRYPDPKPPYERTGAGDAFASTFTAAVALGKTIPEALQWGPINSMSVVQKIGAQAGLLTRPQLEEFLTQAPADYQPRKI